MKKKKKKKKKNTFLLCVVLMELTAQNFQRICKIFSRVEMLNQGTLSGFMTALVARNVFRSCIIKERSVPMVLQIRHRDLLNSPTSSVGNETATGLVYVRI
jgi:hypothetical protein